VAQALIGGAQIEMMLLQAAGAVAKVIIGPTPLCYSPREGPRSETAMRNPILGIAIAFLSGGHSLDASTLTLGPEAIIQPKGGSVAAPSTVVAQNLRSPMAA
jgi:hypothetical protein